VRARTAQPFGLNLFAPPAPEDHSAPVDPRPAIQHVERFYAELGLTPPRTLPKPAYSFDEQMQAVLESGAAVFSFTFGLVPDKAMQAAQARGMFVMGTATSVAEAQALEAAGVDAVIAQGSEAGGHRGTFLGSFEQSMIGTIALVPQIVDAVRVPVVASGGIMDGRGIAAALVLGAFAVQMGTAFLGCAESGVSEGYKAALCNAREDQTRLTRAFSGRPARGVINRFMEETEHAPRDAVLPFPLQNTLTRPLRSAAHAQSRAEYLSLWAGQGVRMLKRETAASLMARLVREVEQAGARAVR
jgi:nitronate monooxygenase